MQGHGHRRAVQLPCRIHAAARWKDMQRSVRSPADAGPPHSLAQAVPAGAWSAWLGWCGARCDCGGKDSQQAPAPLERRAGLHQCSQHVFLLYVVPGHKTGF